MIAALARPAALSGRSIAECTRRTRRLAGFALLLIPLGAQAQSLPQGGQFQAGSGTIGYSSQQLQINQSSARGIIDWHSFNIGPGNAVLIDNGGGATLNRVQGGSPSSILGNLSATGSVYLINPSGIVIGPGGKIVTGGDFIASTLDILNSDFMAGGPLHFQGSSTAAVDNQGSIVSTAGNTYLLGPSVQNEGTIAAPNGTASLGAGQSVLISIIQGGGDPTMFVQAGPGIFKNSGTIAAAQAELRAAGGNPLALSGENTGIIRATGTTVKNGHVWLSAASGDVSNTGQITTQNANGSGGVVTLQADSGTLKVQGSVNANATGPDSIGGEVELLGQLVGLFDSAAVSANGPAGGGTVLIGGNVHGAGPQQNAGATFIAPTATVSADATVVGNGGTVVSWGTEVNNTYGAISAKGGPRSGDGGEVEVSSIDGLNFAGTVDTSAPNGKTGVLLLDPQSLVIATAGGAAYSPGVNNLFANNAAGTNTITPASINSQASNVTLQANTDVTVTNGIAMTNAGVGITIQAGRSVLVNAGISTTNGAINITANDNTALSANRTAGAGAITMAAGTTLNSGTADITLAIGSSAAAPFAPGNMALAGISANNLNLTVPGTSTITQSAGLTVPGTLSVNGGSGAVTLNNAANDFGTAQATTTSGNVSFRDANSLTLGPSSIGGTLGVTAAGAITQSGALSATGTTTLAAGAANDITLGDSSNDFSTVGITTGHNVQLTDTNALILGASTVSGTLAVTTSGAITQSGALAVTGVTTLAAGSGNDITLTTATNNFSTVAVTSANNVSLRDTNALILGTSTVNGTLGVTTSGTISQNGPLTITGTTTLAAGAGNDITLGDSSNDFSTVGITTGHNVQLTDTNALILGASTVSGTLAVTTSGAITQSGALAVTGVTTLAAGSGNDITLATATNNFSTVAVTSANNISLRDTNALILGASTIGGTLGVTTGGALTQSGPLTVTGATTLAAGAANAITLNNASNDFSTVGITTGRNTALADVNAIVLDTSTISGTLGVTAAGAITQSGPLTVTGVTTLAAGATNDITLSDAGNDFSTAAVTSGQNVGLRDANALILGASTVSGTLAVTTSGAITQSGALAVTGVTTLAAGSGNDITLTTATNNFSTVAVTSANNVSLRDTNALILGTSTVNGTLGVTTSGTISQNGPLTITGTTTLAAGAGNDITLGDSSNDFSTVGITTGHNVQLTDTNALILGASTVSGTLAVTTSGAITQSGALAVTGVTTLAAGSGNDITLATATNNFSTVAVTSANNISLRDTNALILGASTIGGTLGVTTGGALTQSGPLTVTGTATIAAGAGNDVTLTDAGNDFSTVAVSSGRNVSLRDSNSLVLGASTVSGTLGVTTSGPITQSGALSVSGVATLAAGAANDITLGMNTNNFATVAITSADNVTLQDTNALILGASTVGGTLGVTTGGAITQSGALTVVGTTTLAAGANNITLNNAGNDFSTVAVTSGQNTNLRDANAIILGPSTIAGTLTVTAAGAITQSGPLSVTGTTTLASGAANDIILADPGNDFSTVAVTSGNNVTLQDSNALILGTSTISGAFNATTAGAITQSGALTVTGATTLAADAANNITLTTATNNFSSVSITSANNVSLRDANALILGMSTVGGTLGVTTAGALTQSGPLTVTGTTTIAAGSGNDVTLTDPGNDFSTMAISSGRNVALDDENALDLGASTVSGALTVTTNGAITQSGALAVTGVTTLAAGSGNDITLATATNNFSTVAVTSANNVSLRDTNALILGASTIGGTLGVTAAGAITQAGALSVTGATTLTAGSTNNITLTNTSNDFSAVAITSGRAVALTDASALDLGPSTVSNALTVTALGGDITQSGTVSANGLTTLSATNDITLDNPGNGFSTVTISSGQDVTVINGGAMTVNGFTASGAILLATENGNLTKAGAIASTAASGGSITLAAGISQPRGTASGGDVKSTGGALTPGTGAEALVYSGAVATTTLTGFAPASASGDFRYDRQYGDPVGSPGVGIGPVFVLYREQPTVTITPDAASKVYGSADPTFTFSTTGLQNGDTPAQAGIDNTVITRQPGETVAGGPYLFLETTDLSQLGYTLSVINPTDAALTITQAVLTIDGVVADNKVYNANTVAILDNTGASLEGIIGMDDVTLDSSAASGSFADANVGDNKPVAAIGYALLGGDAGNYSLEQPTGLQANITTAPLTISALPDSKVYDATNTSTVSPNIEGLQGTDSITGLTQVFNSPNVLGPNGSTLSIQPDFTIEDGSGGNNYSLTLETAAGTITPAPLHIAASTNATKVFGMPDPIFGSAYYTVTLSDLKGSDTAAIITGDMDRAPGEGILGSPYLFNEGTLAASPNYAIEFSNAGEFGLIIAVPSFAGTPTELPPPADISSVIPPNDAYCDSGDTNYGAGCSSVRIDLSEMPQFGAVAPAFIAADWRSFD